ncbi:Tetratricopeptide repeat family protein [sediment metagenome]|uniref:Tetratricopeptide repeat family protein n=1 Tax=sediment metagenome TaxID=749907 RepID=D9PHE0_9ZZZZ
MKKIVIILLFISGVSSAESWDSLLDGSVYEGDGKMVFCNTTNPIKEARDAAQKTQNYTIAYKTNLERLIGVCQATVDLFGNDPFKSKIANQHITEARAELDLLNKQYVVAKNENKNDDILEKGIVALRKDIEKSSFYGGIYNKPTNSIGYNISEAIKHYKMGYSYFESNRYADAIEEFTKAIEINPDSSEAFYERGNSFRKLKDYKSAIKDYLHAKELGANEAYVYSDCGISYAQLGDHSSAIENYTKAIKLNPDDVDAVYYNRGFSYIMMKDYSSAIRDFTSAIGLNPNYAEAYGNRGLAYSYLKAYTSAIRDYTKAINLNPNYAKAYSNRALSFAFKGDLKSTMKDAKQACSLGDCFLFKSLEEKGYTKY